MENKSIKELDIEIKKKVLYILNIISWALSIAIALGILLVISSVILSVIGY